MRQFQKTLELTGRVGYDARKEGKPLRTYMDLKKTLFIVPNLLTAASLFCGVSAILRCIEPEVTTEDIYRSSLLLFYAFIFDLFDGRVARLTRTQSTFGVEFDSLADLISFGVAPAVITYRWILHESGWVGMAVCFVYVAGGAIRLARFNVMARAGKKDETPGKYMLGLPIPMAAGFIVAMVVAARSVGGWPWLTEHMVTIRGIGYPMMMIVIMVSLAVLMVSSVKFRSFKDMKFNAFTITILVITVASSLFLWFKSKPAYILIWLLCAYVALGFGEAVFALSRRGRGKKQLNS